MNRDGDNQRHLDTGARALNALPPDEADAFDAHLADCKPCDDELTGFLETLAVLGAAAAEEPPVELHENVMREIAVTAQLPPLGPHSTAGTVTPIRRWYQRPAGLLMAAAVAAVLIGGGIVGGMLATGNDTDPLVAMEQCVHSAPDTKVMQPSVGSGGQVMMAMSCEAAIVDIGSLPAVPTDKGYQLWVMAGSDARSVGMVQEGADHLKSTFVTPLHKGDTDVGISIEPTGGSAAPTTSPMWVVALIGRG